ncbi:hypothetical protein Ahy_Scaffold6g108124 [Arachis hypogaea]|uniref:SKP1-like protein n=1 Tax=Arachis hypogaea TaxID=3818 RepID=A0A444WPE1_ARAHY|nr:hypothetical protein Ahy_Scaffold6g108124 [Arachis hypogaea]
MLDHPHQAMMRYNYNNPPSFPHQPEATANNGCYADYGGNGYGYGYGRGHDHSGSFGISGFNNNGYGNQNFSGATVNSGYYSADRNSAIIFGHFYLVNLKHLTSKILVKVIEYCKKHVDAAASEEKQSEEDIKMWDAKFVKVDQATLFNLILASNYLNINSLLDLTCQIVADMIKGKIPEEICKTFNIKNDFTPKEEEEVRCENQ